jgi:hypothetical protein
MILGEPCTPGRQIPFINDIYLILSSGSNEINNFFQQRNYNFWLSYPMSYLAFYQRVKSLVKTSKTTIK